VPWRSITLARMDGFMKHLSSRGLNRVTLATFFHDPCVQPFAD
jgi:hypothetical protein